MKSSFRAATFIVAAAIVLTLCVSFVTAQVGRAKRIRFRRGENSAVLKGAAVRGTQDRYFVRADEGQTMTVEISSTEGNANFTVYFAGEQESLGGSEEATAWTGRLVDDNDYVIVVAPTRGNATYSMTVTID